MESNLIEKIQFGIKIAIKVLQMFGQIKMTGSFRSFFFLGSQNANICRVTTAMRQRPE